MRALLLAVRDRLKQGLADGGLAYTAAECEVMFDGQPPPRCGELFVAIHEGYWLPGPPDEDDGSLTELCGVDVTVTVRTGKVPFDRLGTDAYCGPAGQSLEERCRAIIAKLHKDPGPRAAGNPAHYPVLATANATIGAGENGFIEPLVFIKPGKVTPRGPAWFSSDLPDGQAPSGLSLTLHFGGAKRVQVVEEQS